MLGFVERERGEQEQDMNPVVPDYVRFAPKSQEVILLLKRFIRKENMPTCPVKLLTDSDLQNRVASCVWSAADFPYFEQNHYWFFLDRKASKDKNKVDRTLGSLGTWTARGNGSKIYTGTLLVGKKQKFELMKGSVKTGWCKFEYTRHSNKFEKSCVSHLIFANPEVEEYASDISADEEDEEHNEEQGVQGDLEEEAHADGGEDQTQDQEEEVTVDAQTQDQEGGENQTQVQDEEVTVDDQTQVQDEQVPVDQTQDQNVEQERLVHDGQVLLGNLEEVLVDGELILLPADMTQFWNGANDDGLGFEVNEVQELMGIAEAPADGGEDQTQDQEKEVTVDAQTQDQEGGENQTQDQDEEVHVDDQTEVQDEEVLVDDQTQVQDKEVPVDQTLGNEEDQNLEGEAPDQRLVNADQVPLGNLEEVRVDGEPILWPADWTQFWNSANDDGSGV